MDKKATTIAEFSSRCPCGEGIKEGDEIRRNPDDTAWCCESCGFTGIRKKTVVDMPSRGNRGSVMQTIRARQERARRKRAL